ncbi:MAG: hypothetical protein F4Y14_18395 [Acidobacteria bacterium]|nr:hypothetical protein [Acidobacteriota bacterium]
MTVTFPEWEIGQAADKGTAVTYTQTGRVDVFVALTSWPQYDATHAWIDPASSGDWLELDNYNGTWHASAAYPKGHIVDLVDSGGTRLWYIAAEDVNAGRRPGEVSEWLLFGGARTPPVPDAALLPTRWRAPLTIIADACVDTGISLDGLPTGRQVLIRLEPPSGTDPLEQERLILTADLVALDPVAVGDNLLLTSDRLELSSTGSITDRALVARSAGDRLLVQIPDKAVYPAGQAARLTFAHEDAWPLLFFDAVAGDVTFTAAADGSLAGDLSTQVRARLAPTPTEATRGRYVRQSPDGETYELTDEAPVGATENTYATIAQYRARTGAAENVVSDDVLTETFETVARFLDRRLGWCPGGLGPISGEHTLTLWPAARASRILYLRDAEGHLWPLRSWSSIAFDYSGSGTPDFTAASDDDVAWIVGQPAGADSRPWRALRILEAHSDGRYGIWPTDPGTVAITGTGWGHGSVVGAARDLVIHVSRAMLDSHAGGGAAVAEIFEQTIRTVDAASRMWRLLEMEFSAGRPGRLGVLTSAAGRRRRR